MGTPTSSGSSASSNNDLAKILAKAWTDNGFKNRLISDPPTVFAEERVSLPTGYSTGDKVSIPRPPANLSAMSPTQVQAAASTTLSSGAEMF